MNLPREYTINFDDILSGASGGFNEDFADDFLALILDYLTNKFGYCINSFTLKSGKIKITDIDWDTEES